MYFYDLQDPDAGPHIVNAAPGGSSTPVIDGSRVAYVYESPAPARVINIWVTDLAVSLELMALT